MPYVPKSDGRDYAIFPKATVDPKPLDNNGKVYTKAVGGVTQLFYQADDGTVYQLTPPGGAGGGGLIPTPYTGDCTVQVGQMGLVTPELGQEADVTLENGANDGDRIGFQWYGGFENTGDPLNLLLANIAPLPAPIGAIHTQGFTQNLDLQGAVYVWRASDSLWYLESTIVWAMAPVP